jgi:hypothetical protein
MSRQFAGQCRAREAFCHTVLMTNPDERPSSDDPQATRVELVWPENVGADAQAVNQVVVSWDQNVQDVLYLYLGHVSPLPWLSSEFAEERLQELGNKLPVTPKGSFILSRTRAEELWTVLGRHLGKLPK